MKTFFTALLTALIFGSVGQAETTVNALPDLPAGIHYAVPRNALQPGNWQRELQTTEDCMDPCVVEFDDRVSAVYLRYKWMQLNPKKDVYDFSEVGAVIDRVREAGKVVTIIVMAGKYTPEWVFEEGAEHIDTAAKSGGDFSQELVALPWDPVFMKSYGQMISLLSAFLRQQPERYDTVVLVKNGALITHSGETRLMPAHAFMSRKDREDPSMEAAFTGALCDDWAKSGYSETKILEAASRTMADVDAAFSDKYLGIAFVSGSNRFPTVDGAGNCLPKGKNSTLNKIVRDLVKDYGTRVIANSTTLASGGVGQPPILDWVRKHGGHIGYQANAQQVGCRKRNAPCDLRAFQEALQEGAASGAVFIEVHDGNINRHQDVLREMNRVLQGR